MSKKVRDKRIDPKRFYSLGEIVREQLIPSVDSIAKASRLVRNDLLFNKVLRAQVVATGDRILGYKIRGSNIINFLTQYHNG